MGYGRVQKMQEKIIKAQINKMITDYPVLQKIMDKKPTLWMNPDINRNPSFPVKGVEENILTEARERFHRFKPVLTELFPEIARLNGEIISPLTEIDKMKNELQNHYHQEFNGKLLLKRDDVLPIAGSIKARGGFHEVLAVAEKLALEKGLLETTSDDYKKLLLDSARDLFKQYTISVGSTGNLGLSIGMIGSALGFQVVVHMSVDAKKWKKDLLRKNGVTVVEYESDYSVAVENARKESAGKEKSYFVDDENSSLLFAGYSAAAIELKKQLGEMDITVNSEHPLYVYLPCGVGGGPGGITFGLKRIFGENVHCFFAEPTHSPCMLVGLLTKLHHQISVQDFGLDNKTEADGLAVGRPSLFVGELMEELLSGVYTIEDDELLKLEYLLYQSENIFLEPSALAGMKGPMFISSKSKDKPNINAVHIVWATGGSLVPNEMRETFLNRGKGLLD